MRVTVRLFARLKEIAGAAELPREVDPGALGGLGIQVIAKIDEGRRLSRRSRGGESRERQRVAAGGAAADELDELPLRKAS